MPPAHTHIHHGFNSTLEEAEEQPSSLIGPDPVVTSAPPVIQPHPDELPVIFVARDGRNNCAEPPANIALGETEEQPEPSPEPAFTVAADNEQPAHSPEEKLCCGLHSTTTTTCDPLC